MRMNDETRKSVDDFATRIMAEKLIGAGADLSDETAIRDTLRSARFGEQLIENCAESAVERARLLRI